MRTLIIFVKMPQAGRVKTRLARDLGPVRAAALYRALAAPVIRRLGRDPRWHTVLSVAPDRFARVAGPWPEGLVREGQGRGDLGVRMERALAAPQPGPVVLIGSDVPDVRSNHIERAFRALGAHDAVFGPAEDGGFWLVGLRRRPFPRGLFRNVCWSTEHALEDVLANLRPRYSVAFTDTLTDIDTGADWERWRERGVHEAARRP